MTAALGARLRAAGLTPRALASWAGTARIPALPARLDEVLAHEPVPAAAALALFVGGAELDVRRHHALPIDELIAAELVERTGERTGERLRARVAILPVGPSLIVCDRRDAASTEALVCWPDDSSLHLASAIPAGRVARWLDLGCGSAYAPLARPELATAIVGVDLNARAVGYSRLGAALSGVAHLTIEHGDLARDQPHATLVTCNAPMPSRSTASNAMWRRADDDLFTRLVTVIPERVAPGGLAIVHGALSALALERLPGERVAVAYTPPGGEPAFGVLWWWPDRPARLTIAHRALTVSRPHLDVDDVAAVTLGGPEAGGLRVSVGTPG